MNKEKWLRLKSELGRLGFIHGSMLDVTFASYVSINWHGEPLWILAIGPPSSGKTCSVMPIALADRITIVSTLTPASLITVYGGKDDDRSLFARIDKNLLIIKDFGTILSMGWEPANQVLSLLREAFDGFVSKEFSSIRREYSLKFNCIAVSTQVADSHNLLGQQLGERFLKYRPKAVRISYPKVPLNEFLPVVVKKFIEELDIPDKPDFPVPIKKLFKAAEIAAQLRTVPIHDRRLHEIVEVPDFEQPHRLTSQLHKLWAGIYCVTGDKDYADAIALKAALDSIPPQRIKIFSMLFRRRKISTPEIIRSCGCGPTVTRMILKDMEALGLLEHKSKGFPHTHVWNIPDDFRADVESVFGKL